MNTRDLVWDMFCKSGNIGDYMLYNELSKEKESLSCGYDQNQGYDNKERTVR